MRCARRSTARACCWPSCSSAGRATAGPALAARPARVGAAPPGGQHGAASRQRRDALGALAAQLELLNPQRTLERGYAIVSNAEGKVLRARADQAARHQVLVRLAEGSAEVKRGERAGLLEQ
jgi:hypothetical protein